MSRAFTDLYASALGRRLILYASALGRRLILNPEGTRLRIWHGHKGETVEVIRAWSERQERNGWICSYAGFLTDEELIARYCMTDGTRIERLETVTVKRWRAL